MKRRILGALLCIGGILLHGCAQSTCRATCEQIYVPDLCGLTVPGLSVSQSIDGCTATCRDGMQTLSGELGEYSPTTEGWASMGYVPPENNAQAVAWIDCVWEYAPDANPTQCNTLLADYCGLLM